MDFDVAAALKSAESTLQNQLDNVVERATTAHDASAQRALDYATHLADGGDPREYPEIPYSHGNSPLISPEVGMNIVYRAWNEARGSMNPVSPVRNVSAWQVAEMLHEQVGTPVLLSALSQAYVAVGHPHKGTPDEIARVVIAAQVTDKLVARKTKLNSKVAYVLREALDGEEPAKSTWDFPVEDTRVETSV